MSMRNQNKSRGGLPFAGGMPAVTGRLIGLLTMIGLVMLLSRPTWAQVKVACIGDSITYGSGLPDRGTQSYPAVLGQMLGPDYEVKNFGVSGATMLRRGDRPYWNQRALVDSSDYAPDIVIIMLGTNDTKPQNWQYGDEYEGDYVDMIAHYTDLSSSPTVFAVRPCPAYGVAFGINPDIIEFEVVPLVDQIGQETGSPVIDVFTALSDHADLFPDRIHPNPEGARLIAEAVYQALSGNASSASRR